MKHYGYKCNRCGAISDNEFCYCNLLNPKILDLIKFFFESKGVKVKKISVGESGSAYCQDGIERLWIFTDVGRFDLPRRGGMGIIDDKVSRSFNKYCNDLFKGSKIETSKSFVVKINNTQKTFYGLNKAEVRREAEEFILKNTKIEFV